MFSQECVKNSVHRGEGVCLGRQQPPQQTTPWADTPQADTPIGRHPFPQNRHPQVDTPRQPPPLGRHPWADTPHPGQTPALSRHLPPPPETTSAADGMHPAGMDSCICFSHYLTHTFLHLLTALEGDGQSLYFISLLVLHFSLRFSLKMKQVSYIFQLISCQIWIFLVAYCVN